MASKIRDILQDFNDKECEFIATVEYSNYKQRKLILVDIAKPKDYDDFEVVATHLQVRNVDDKILKTLHIGDIIMFKAVVYKYDGDVSEYYRNFSLGNVRKIKKIRGVYNGK